MNFTLISTLQATGATTALTDDNISSSTENYSDKRGLSQDIGNVTRISTKVSIKTFCCGKVPIA